MSESSQQHGLSALDRGYALRLEGDAEGALRVAAAILTAAPDDLGAAYLVARQLLDAERSQVAGEGAERLVDACIRRGDPAMSVVAAQLALEAGGFADKALSTIAAAFGMGSKRAGDVAPRPPALPVNSEVPPYFLERSGEALLEAAEKALAQFVAAKDPVAADAPLPVLPLFGAMHAPSLARLLGALELREVAAGEHVINQGESGQEAFILARGVLNVVRKAGSGHEVLAALGPGSILGEMALVSASPRAASVVAVEPVLLLCVSRTHLEGLARQDPAVGQELGAFCHGRMIANLIRHSAILSEVDPQVRRDLVDRFTSSTFQAGDVLVREGEEPACLFLLASGGVEVRSTDADGDRVVLAELGPGDVVGEISLVLRRPANADVTALHPTVALQLTRDQFQEAIREHPTLLTKLYEMATERDEETRSVVAQKALDVSDVVLL